MSHARLRSLEAKHAAIHAKIESERQSPSAYLDGTLDVLKRQKLGLKDQIERLKRANGHAETAA